MLAAQLEVGYLTVSASWPSALNCNPCNHAPLTACECCGDCVQHTPLVPNYLLTAVPLTRIHVL